MEIVTAIAAGLAAGVFLGYLLGRRGRQGLVSRCDVLQSRLESMKEQAEKSEAEIRRHCQQLMEQKDKASAEAMAAMQAKFDETMQKVSAQVRTATDDMLRQRQK